MLNTVQAQINPDKDYNKIIPSTPETYSIFKAGDYPVDYRTGKLNVSVPLHTISTKYGVSIPINLAYNTGGIKVDETSSTVGLGWALSIPNSISVEVHGKEDLNSSARWFPSNIYDYQYIDPINIETFPTDIQVKLQAVRDDVVDTEPDIYHYSLPTISGSFTRDTNGNFHTIPYENVKISYSDADNKFTITDPSGIVYLLRVGNSLSSLSTSPFSYRASFLLEKLTLPNNEEITFKYDKYISYKSITHGYTDLYYPIPIATDHCVAGQKDVHTATTNRYIDKLPTEITYNNETVKFNYTNIINGITGRKDVFTETPENAFALDEIKVIDNQTNKVIRDFKLVHDYFTSSGIVTPEYRKYRLKLLRVENLLENSKYSFNYNEENKPIIGSYAQDVWGYYNGKQNNNNSLIPNMHYFNKDYTQGADRNVDANYSQAYILNKVTYPTGGSSAFTYENNSVWGKLLIPQRQETEYDYINNSYTSDQNEYDNILMTTPSNEYFYVDVDPVNPNEQLWAEFANSCSNQIPNEIPENGSSMGMAYLEEFVNNQWKNLATFSGADVAGPLTDGNPPATNKFFLHPQAPKRIRVRRMGNCSTTLKISKIKYVNEISNQNNIVGGLRIKSIEDFDGTTTYTKRQFQYHNPSLAGEQSSGSFASPLKFLDIIPREVEFEGKSLLCNMYGLSADQAINSSLLGKDVINYEYVTEHTLGKGRKVYQFIAEGNELDLSNAGNGFNPFRLINKNLINEKFYTDNGTSPLKEIIYNYSLTYLKNALSSNSYGNPLMVAPYGKIAMIDRNVSTASGGFYSTQVLESYPIESGKFILDEILTKDYVNGNSITTKINNEYSLSDIEKPINLLKQTVIHTNNDKNTETNYQYAHEKANQKLISANMIGIPLETSIVNKKDANDVSGKLISKSETKYDNPANLFPTSVLSYDLQNPTVSSTEVTYDKYDSKGNLQQYTTKEGISTTIIWGYNNTQPIAKVEGAKLSDISQSAIDAIVNASNTDASAVSNNDETSFLDALKTFKNSLPNYQITTYTYDPLIGVRSITPPSGIRELYKYDTANRLEKVIDINGKVLKEFKYNYKN